MESPDQSAADTLMVLEGSLLLLVNSSIASP